MALVLVAALAGAGSLVTKNQESRSKASFASVEALFLPSTKTLSVGDEFITTLMIDTKSHLLTGTDLMVKYDPAILNLESASVLTKDGVSGMSSWLQSPEEILISEINNEKGTFNLVGTNIQKEVTGLATGAVNIVKLKFRAMAGGEAKITLDNNYENIVSGYNVAGSDQELKIEKVSEAIYKVSGTTPTSVISPIAIKCGWCGTNCVDINKSGPNMVCPAIYVEGKECVNKSGVCSIIATGPTMVPPEEIKCVLCGNECIDSKLLSSTTVCPTIQTAVTEERLCVNTGSTGCKMLIRSVEVEQTE